jgi:hypothetical protein
MALDLKNQKSPWPYAQEAADPFHGGRGFTTITQLRAPDPTTPLVTALAHPAAQALPAFAKVS